MKTLPRLLPLLSVLSTAAPLAVPLLAVPRATNAQTPKSQLGVVSQLVAGNRIEITYRRPVARGRELFGALVPWSLVWSPSADTAARMSISAPIVVNGSRLAAGTYSIWAIPDSVSWVVIFNNVGTVFHLRYPRGEDALRVRAKPVRGDYIETLMFAFSMVDADSARLDLRWGTTVVPLSIRNAP